jgi:hypothetical protein
MLDRLKWEAPAKVVAYGLFTCGLHPKRESGRPQSSKNSKIEEHTMKMDSALVDLTLSQIKAEAIPDDHPALPKLKDLFGDHTFFLDPSGLNIIEPVEERPLTGMVVNVASWDDEDPPHLLAHQPESTNVLIEFATTH